MQPILDGPRADLDPEVVRELLQSHRALQISYGAVALDDNFAEQGDISAFMSGGRVESDITSTIHRTCRISLDGNVTAATEWSYLSGFIKPYVVFTDPETEESAQFNLGVYTLTTPVRMLGLNPPLLVFDGYDLIYLLRQPLGDSYEVSPGVEPAQAAADVIGEAIPGIEVVVEDSGSTLDKRMSWPFDSAEPVTYYEIVRDLLDSIGYQPIWVDWEGRFQIGPFIDLQDENVEWTFDLSDVDNIVADDREQDIDLYEVPNWWRFVIADLDASPVEGTTMFTWEDDSDENPGSTTNRGRTLRHIESVPATSYDDLVNYAQRRIADMLEPSEKFNLTTQPFPLAWHFDLIRYVDQELATALPETERIEREVLAAQWRLDLSGEDDMEWEWVTVGTQSAVEGYTESEVSP